MLSHLRFHRRASSNPASPAAEQHPSPSSYPSSPFSSDAVFSPHSQPPSSSITSTSTSLAPPVLPPITRVTSNESLPLPDFSYDSLAIIAEHRISRPDPSPSHYTCHSATLDFIDSAALNNHQPDTPQTTSNLPPLDHSQPRPKPDPAPPSLQQDAAPDPVTPRQSFSIISSHSSKSPPSIGSGPFSQSTGRRTSARAINTQQQSSLSSASPATSMDPQKSKRGLPFLKNPVSALLMRRKLNQNLPEPLSLPVSAQDSEPAYDPRIKGTRVHDFSAPRQRNVPQIEENRPCPSFMLPNNQTRIHSQPIYELPGCQDFSSPQRLETQTQISPSPSALVHDGIQNGPRPDYVRNSDSSSLSISTQNDTISTKTDQNSRHGSGSFRRVSPSTHTNSTHANAACRKPSVSETSGKDTLASLPKHMKSTSSRFSFDMIGAAKQEKILEDRHRQRQLEKGAPEDVDDVDDGKRDSRFDEIDDGFDYDAMMDDDDDGLEERIPGVNADFEEDPCFTETTNSHEVQFHVQDDSGNDQGNFAGFVFQPSTSPLCLAGPLTPGQVPAPRDAQGQAIGLAWPKDTQSTVTSPLSAHNNLNDRDPIAVTQDLAGLGINEHPLLETTIETKPATLNPAFGDELYFDDGQVGYENEFAEDLAAERDPNAEPFDESIFDNNDTDQFGRPVPGAFSQTPSLRQAAVDESKKRESDATCRSSAPSCPSRSTARTSFSGGGGGMPNGAPNSSKISPLGRASSLFARQSLSQRKIVAYQAALAAAAHEAVASGKFHRSASPVLEDETVDQDTLKGHDNHGTQESTFQIQDEVKCLSGIDDSVPDVDDDFLNANDHVLHAAATSATSAAADGAGGDGDDFGYENMDDFDLDDDAIIAEANASALANDSDGFYSQEFGFYAAPANQNHASHISSASSSKEYFYSNGGFFGPKGDLDRSNSGRLACREPNLTPITERSEYSNRNSFMSLGHPPVMGGTPTVQSPGLAQLAMMSDRGEEMTFSALLRLRSKAWGGSQVSLGSSREGSPNPERGELASSPRTAASPSVGGAGLGASHMRQNILFFAGEGGAESSDFGSQPGSPWPTTKASVFLGQQSPHAQARAVVTLAAAAAGTQQGSLVRGNSAPGTYASPRSLTSSMSESPALGSAAQGKGSREGTWYHDSTGLPAGAVSLSQKGNRNGNGSEKGKCHHRQQRST